MDFAELQAAVSEELFLTFHTTFDDYMIVVIQTILVVALMRPMLQMKGLALTFVPGLVFGGLAGIRALRLSGFYAGDYVGTIVIGSTAGIALSLVVLSVVARLLLELLASRRPVTLDTRV